MATISAFQAPGHRRPSALRLWLMVACGLCSATVFPEVAKGASPDSHPLDATERIIAAKGKPKCPKIDLVTHKGKKIRFSPAGRVNEEFARRLELFEDVVATVSLEVYGRVPKRVLSLGTYNCRRIAAYPTYLSEHGLGNAIDVSGFEFGRAEKKAAFPPNLPKSLRGPFRVSVLKHWDANSGAGKIHSDFLQTLAQRLIERDDIFRVLLGPGFPGHKNHFHFDCSPWRIVEVF